MGAFCSCTRGEMAVRVERTLHDSHVFPNKWAADVSPEAHELSFLEATRDSDMESVAVPGVTMLPNGPDAMYDHGGRRQGMGSRRSLGESGLGSTGMSSTLGSHRSVTLSMPATPHAIRQKPPPKPPRLRQMSTSGVTPPISPGIPSHSPASTLSNKSFIFEGGANTSFHSLPTDIQPISRIYPTGPRDKIYNILLQTKDVLVNEINASALIRPLRCKNILDDRAVAELQAVSNEGAANALLLDILMGKSRAEFILFCEVLRFITKSSTIPDLLLALDYLVDLTPSGSTPAEGPATTQMNGSPPEPDSGPCDMCSQHEWLQLPDFGLDTSNFDVEILYIDKTSGESKTLHEVTPCKKEKRAAFASGQIRNSTASDITRFDADKYIPVITVALYNYCLWGANIDKVAKALYKKSSIRELSLAKCHLNAQSLRILSSVVQNNQGLHKLDLRLNHLDEDAMAQLSEGLRKCSCVRVINLSSTEITPGGCHALVQSISKNQTTNDLDIGFNDLQDKGCDILAEALAMNCPLKRLRIRHNGIKPDGAFHLCKALKKNAHLCYLDISCNNLGDKSMLHMSEMLRYNRTVKQLNLEKCNISKDGCVALVRALKSNTSLRSLTMNMNPLGDEGVEALSDGLKYNQTLDILCLNMCGVTNKGFLGMLEALQFNMTLKILKLCYNQIGMPLEMSAEDTAVAPVELVYAKLCHILQHNKDLKVLLWGNRLDEDECALENVFDQELISLGGGHGDIMTDSVSYQQPTVAETVNGCDHRGPASLPGNLAGEIAGATQPLYLSLSEGRKSGNDSARKFVRQYMIHGANSPEITNEKSDQLLLQIPNGSLQQIQNRIQVSPCMGMSARANIKTAPGSPKNLDMNSNRNCTDSESSVTTLKSVSFTDQMHPHQSKIRTNGSLPRKPKHNGGLAVATEEVDYPTWPRQTRSSKHQPPVKTHFNSSTLSQCKPA